LVPAPVVIADVAGGVTDDANNGTQTPFFLALNGAPNPFAAKTHYYVLVGTDWTHMTPAAGAPPLNPSPIEVQWELANGSTTSQSDGILSQRNTAGIGVLDGRGVVERAYVSTDHLHMGGLESVFASAVPASGYAPVIGPLPVQVTDALSAWMATF
jgi:hypothetical protein